MVPWWWILVTAVLVAPVALVIGACLRASKESPPCPRPKRFTGQRDPYRVMEEDTRGDAETKETQAPAWLRGQGGPGPAG